MAEEEPPLTEYPKNSAAFGRLMRGTGEDQQTRVSAAISTSIAAVRELDIKLNDLQVATESASTKSTEALGKLGQSIENLRTATDTWSRWLTRFTIAICGFTLVLVVLGIAQVCR